MIIFNKSIIKLVYIYLKIEERRKKLEGTSDFPFVIRRKTVFSYM